MSCLALLLACGPAYTQTTFATITGSVSDASGAAVPKAKIIAVHTGTTIEFPAESNGDGIYIIPQLKEGSYEVRIQAPGFKEFVARDIALVSRDLRRVDAVLQVGDTGTRVEVTAGATLIETETGRINDVKSADIVRALPVNARGLFAYLPLSPNVLQGSDGAIRIAGSRNNQAHWSMDGTTMSDGVDDNSIGPFGNFVESFQEIKVDSANNSAEFGPLGQITVISKSGSNALHGNVFDYYRTPVFLARNPFSPARPTGINHLPGASLGGPVWIPGIYHGKNRSFFFVSYETGQGSNTNQLLNPTVPLASWRTGDFSGLGSTIIYDPQNGSPFPGNRIPASRINAVSQKLQDRFYPLPNFGSSTALQSQNYRETKSRPWDPATLVTARGDHHFSDKDSVFGRFTFQRSYNRPYEGNLPTIGTRDQVRNNRAVSASYTHVFKSNLLSEFRYGFALNNNPIHGPVNGLALVKELGLTGLASDLPDMAGIFKVNFTGLGLQGISQTDTQDPGFRNHLEDFQEHLSWFHGRHNVKFGANLERVEWDQVIANPNLFGSVSFSNRFTGAGIANQGSPYADFLLGIPTTVSRAFAPLPQDRNRWQYDFFATDDFKVSQRLTLNLGVRYELHPPWNDGRNTTSLFDVATGKIIVEDGALPRVSALFPKNYVSIAEASSVGLPAHTLMRTDRNNFAPRIGAAYRPWDNNTVFRAGFGVYYDVSPRNPTGAGIPFVLNEPSYTNPAANPDVIFPRVFPAGGVAGPGSIALPAAVNPNLRTPYSMQYNFTIERQQWNTGFRASYIGTGSRKLDYSYNYNSPLPDTRAYVDKPRPFPNFPDIAYWTNGAGQQYNGLTVEAKRQMSNGLYFQASWAFVRDRYDLFHGESLENAFDRHREVAVATDTPTHRVTGNFVYELPFGKGRHWLSSAPRWLNALAGGWEISGIYNLHSGQFLTPTWSGPDPTGTYFTSSRTAPTVTIRADQLRDGNLPADQRTINRWFDPAAFGAPAAGRFGTSAKGVIKGPGVNVLAGGVDKSFRFSERTLLRWEFTGTNVFNHPNYSNPSMNISQLSSVGVITGVGGVNGGSTGDNPGARTLRMGLRLEW